jgi:hypothetical protein
MFSGLCLVAVGHVGMMSGSFVISFFVMLVSLGVVLGSFGMMPCSFLVM